MLTKQDYQSALDVQSACNLQAVINSLHRLMPRIAAECNGTDEINQHPICRMYAEQIASLTAAGSPSNSASYYKAYEICEERSK